jgi:hypothetical protein
LLDRHFRSYLIRINDARSPEGKDEWQDVIFM